MKKFSSRINKKKKLFSLKGNQRHEGVNKSIFDAIDINLFDKFMNTIKSLKILTKN